MKLSIELWIAERYHSANINELFKESVICYRNEAFRASLLLSYIGFLTIIKENILQSKPASDFSDLEWNNQVRKKVPNHEFWEEAVTNALLQGTKVGVKPIFRLTDDLREQILYWRRRRNDAAHNKDNEIGGHHTEAFWSFIKSNIPKMTVNGGMAGLLNKFSDHFDDEKTPPGTSVKPLVQEISTSLLESQLSEFFETLPKRIDGRLWYFKSDTAVILNEVFNLVQPKIIDAMIAYLKENNRDLKFLNSYPNRIMQMNYSASELRQLWKKRIFSVDNVNPFNFYCELIRNEVIPVSELENVNASIFNLYDQRSRRFLPESENDILALSKFGFLNYLFDRVITKEKLKWVKEVNSKCDLILLLVKNYPFNVEIVSTVCNLGNKRYASNWLIDAIENLFDERENLKKSFNKIAVDNNLSIPVELKV